MINAHRYAVDLFAREDDILQAIQTEARRSGLPSISLDAEEGRLLQVLMRTVQARTVLEFGALGGYSGVWLARALPTDGHLYTLEMSPQHAQVARAAYRRAGVAERITLVEGEARHTLPTLNDKGPFDFMFVDADPQSYPHYLTWITAHLRVGGMLTVHNALEASPDAAFDRERSRGMAAFNQTLANDSRFESVLLPYSSGMTIAVKISG